MCERECVYVRENLSVEKRKTERDRDRERDIKELKGGNKFKG